MELTTSLPLKCLIVDDEALAHEVIKNYLSQMDKAVLIGQCYSGSEAFNFILNKHVDLVFLDINMPEINGLDLIKGLNNPPKIIFTTAYADYALVGYELDVIDYLLKPISFPRFLKAFNKALNARATPAPEPHFVDIKLQGCTERILFSELAYVESMGNYVKLFLSSRTLIIPGTLRAWNDQTLPKSTFCRVHKSFIVNIAHLSSLTDSAALLNNGKKIPLGRQYKEIIQEKLKQRPV